MDYTTKQEAKLEKALKTLLKNSIDAEGFPMAPTVEQLKKARKAVDDYEAFKKRYSFIGNLFKG
jgi:hypothetical protein